MRGGLRLAVIALWVVLVATLLRQGWSITPPAEPLPEGGAAVPTDEWMGVYREGQKIGYVHLAVIAEDVGYRFEERSLLRLNVMETPQTVRTLIDARTGADFALQRVRFELQNGPARFRVEGRSEGSHLHLRTEVGGEESTAELPLEGPIYLPSSLRRMVAAGALEPGRRYRATVFDPSLLKERDIVTKVIVREKVPDTAPSIEGWRIEEELGGLAGVTTTAWVDGEGKVLREEGPMGLVLVRESAQSAVTANWEDGATLDLVAAVSIPVEPALSDPGALQRLRLRLGGVDLDLIPSGGRQQLDGNVLTVEREVLPETEGFDLPYGGEAWHAEVLPSPLLQSDHPRIRHLAAQILDGERRPLAAAKRLATFVYESLRKVPTVSVPNALQVLDLGEGDCNEHAVLLAALARAAGLPARVVAGVVYLDGAFYYHAWNEVWVGAWLSVDPVLRQLPADVTHVKFVAGGPEDHLAMIGVIGRLTIDVMPGEDMS